MWEILMLWGIMILEVELGESTFLCIASPIPWMIRF